ncbi:hypothetical protein CYY_007610 [Polysphondylium violaceum]|uniref:Transmembrane protein n=1 Tax=Polysphondylium violaceum TaxID=133409 RepID=A0A8J4PP25_9MYCE|nr:hypothetical protein CYY_007610 [Polysphondylium violaceum]
MKNPFKNFNIMEYSPIQKNKDKIEICGASPLHCAKMTLIILILWGVFIGVFIGLLHGYMDVGKHHNKNSRLYNE